MATDRFESQETQDDIDALIVTKTLVKENINIPSNSHSDVDFNIEHSGYTPIGIIGWTINGNPNVATIYANLVSATTARVRVRNLTTSAQTIPNIIIIVLYVKS